MKYFGTDGIRQSADSFTLNFIMSIVEGLVDYSSDNIKVLIAGDTRESTEWLLTDLETALETFGIEYSNAGVLPTPAINYCFYKMGFDFAIDVTASHNPYTDNGIKIFERGDNGGQKLSQKGCEIIESKIKSQKTYTPIVPSLRESLHKEALDLYKEHLLDYIGECNFKGFKIGLDCANGATSIINKEIFEQLGAKVKLIHSNAKYNTKINENCGSTHLQSLQKLVADNSLDFGIAFDGDGDRCILINEIEEEVDGDQILAILAEHLKIKTIATTVMVNQGLLNWTKKKGINVEITAVGDANVKAAMDENHIKLGGEQSGHIILPGEPTGDGMLTSLMITKVLSEKNKSLGELTSNITRFPQVIVNLPATSEQKKALSTKESVKKILLEYDQKLRFSSGRLLVRPSGTEPLIRITMWGNDEDEITDLANRLKDALIDCLR